MQHKTYIHTANKSKNRLKSSQTSSESDAAKSRKAMR